MYKIRLKEIALAVTTLGMFIVANVKADVPVISTSATGELVNVVRYWREAGEVDPDVGTDLYNRMVAPKVNTSGVIEQGTTKVEIFIAINAGTTVDFDIAIVDKTKVDVTIGTLGSVKFGTDLAKINGTIAVLDIVELNSTELNADVSDMLRVRFRVTGKYLIKSVPASNKLLVVDTTDMSEHDVSVTVNAGAIKDVLTTGASTGLVVKGVNLELTSQTSFGLWDVPAIPNVVLTQNAEPEPTGFVEAVVIDFIEPVTLADSNTGTFDGDQNAIPEIPAETTVTVTNGATENLVKLNFPGEDNKLNTGISFATTGAIASFTPSESSSYTRIYELVTNTGFRKRTPPTLTAPTVIDGAKPVLLSATRTQNQQTEGTLSLTFSEPMADIARTADIDVDGNTLELAAVNSVDENTQISYSGLSTEIIDSDTVNFKGIDTIVLDDIQKVNIVTNTASVQDKSGLDALVLKTAVDAEAVTAFAEVNAPRFENAYAVKMLEGIITNIFLTLNEEVTQKGNSVPTDFLVQFYKKNGDFLIAVKVKSVDVNKNQLDLTLVGSGIDANLVAAAKISYTDTSAGVNTYQDKDIPQSDLVAIDSEDISISKNSESFYIQELAITIKEGENLVTKGSLVKAVLVLQANQDFIKKITAAVPYVKNDDSIEMKTIAVEENSRLINAIVDARQAKLNTISRILVTDTENNRAWFDKAIDNRVNLSNYPVTINVTDGTFVGDNDIEGKVTITKAGDYTQIDEAASITGVDGLVRMSVGIRHETLPILTTKGASAFILLSVKQPNENEFVLLTSAVPEFNNYLPFSSQLKAELGRATKKTYDISQIEVISLRESEDGSEDWQMIGVTQVVDQTKQAKFLNIDRLLITIDPETAMLRTMWSYDLNGTQQADDSAFTLSGNKIALINEYQGITSGALPALKGGKGIAISNKGSNVEAKLYIPIVAAKVLKSNISAGWNLITFASEMTGRELKAADIEMVMDLNGKESRVWSKESADTTNSVFGLTDLDEIIRQIESGELDIDVDIEKLKALSEGGGLFGGGADASNTAGQNSLASVEAGKTYFVYFNKAQTDQNKFTFGN